MRTLRHHLVAKQHKRNVEPLSNILNQQSIYLFDMHCFFLEKGKGDSIHLISVLSPFTEVAGFISCSLKIHEQLCPMSFGQWHFRFIIQMNSF